MSAPFFLTMGDFSKLMSDPGGGGLKFQFLGVEGNGKRGRVNYANEEAVTKSRRKLCHSRAWRQALWGNLISWPYVFARVLPCFHRSSLEVQV